MRIKRPGDGGGVACVVSAVRIGLVGNDVTRLTRLFWDAQHAVRMGLTENLYGIDEISAFRKVRPPANLARTLRRLDIVTFGQDFGSITLEFERTVDGRLVRGRQSQVWARFSEGCRIGGLRMGRG